MICLQVEKSAASLATMHVLVVLSAGKGFQGVLARWTLVGLNRENWRARTGTEHRMLACRLLSMTTKSERAAAETSSGCRYSVLLELPYLNAPRMLIVDPMHNLFLGSAKHFMKIVIERMLLSNSQFELLQHRMDRISAPATIGRIPCKIQSGFASFTADQWKNWVIYFSLISMHDILDSDVLECWRHFVLGCRVLCRKSVTAENVQLGDAHLMQFCKRMERLFGRQCITPNMHMHGHLCSCMLDYGPLHGFWLYAFERYNAILGRVPHNNHSIEVQIMSRFLRDNEVFNAGIPSEFIADFKYIFPDNTTETISGSLGDTIGCFHRSPSYAKSWAINSPGLVVHLPSHYIRAVFDEREVELLTVSSIKYKDQL